jgi:tartrate dehydratase alpha subunit/fumarate hydratase class I-like protein
MAGVDKLRMLHDALADMFLENIRICKEEGIPMSAADMGVMVTFLKNNNITADITDEKIQAVKEEFNDELRAAREKAAKRILDNASDPLAAAL